MSARAEARVLSRILRIGLLVAVAAQFAWSLRPAAGHAQAPDLAQGRSLYQANCSTCHGLGAQGTQNGPSLQNLGPAAVSFMVSSGRMPLSNPQAQPARGPSKFTPSQIDALVAYVQTIAPGGVPIPDVNPSEGDLVRGSSLFLANCSGCHGAGGTGDSVGGGQIAPSLYAPDATQIGEAIRTGPGVMPVFGDHELSPADVDSLARYLLWIRDHGSEGGLQLGRVGAVAEGLAAVVVGLGLLILVLRLTGTKA
jgi:quinol---cytochrome-c reductase cytochrome c subunit